MAKFRIDYQDPETGDYHTVEKDFTDSENPRIAAEMWAEDWAYGAADKGWHKVTRLKEKADV